MKYSISELLSFVDCGWIDGMSDDAKTDFCMEIAENIDEYQGQISLARRFAPSTSDLDMLDYLDSLLLDVFYSYSAMIVPFACRDCTKENCITCDINNYGHKLHFGNDV